MNVKRYPGIKLVGQPYQVVGRIKKRLHQDAKQSEEDQHLGYHWTQATKGANAGVFVQLHSFLGYSGPIAAVPRLDFLNLGLHGGHAPHLPQLLEGKGKGSQPHHYGKNNYCEAHVVEKNDVQHQQGVEHRPDDYLGPEGD